MSTAWLGSGQGRGREEGSDGGILQALAPERGEQEQPQPQWSTHQGKVTLALKVLLQ